MFSSVHITLLCNFANKKLEKLSIYNRNASKEGVAIGSSILQVDFPLFYALKKIPKLEPFICLKCIFRMPNKTKYQNLKFNVPNSSQLILLHSNNVLRIKYTKHWTTSIELLCIYSELCSCCVHCAAMTFHVYYLTLSW